VVKHVDASNCASLSPQYSPSPPIPCICTIMREEEAWRRGARGRERAGRSGVTLEPPCGSLARETGNAGGASILNRKMK
jgi:hypothetical protein